MIVIPMGGESSRFYKAGYSLPKFMLNLTNETLFERCMRSFEEYFDSEDFLFITKDNENIIAFVEDKLKAMGVKSFQVIPLIKESLGQAHTVAMGLENCTFDEQNLYIFNIDTIRPNFKKYKLQSHVLGCLEVFEGEGDNWSFVKLNDEGFVSETAEKNAISNLCSTGMYYFNSMESYKLAMSYYDENSLVKGEMYIAPIYNYLIRQGAKISIDLIEEQEVIFCGTPEEYELLKLRGI